MLRPLLLSLALVSGTVPAPAAEPPRIGLVLGGGGARGAAHIGVLEVLERLRVPVHCITGTSMGALVAGGWALGISPEGMRGALTVADWDDLFFDSADYRDLSLRNKHLLQRFLPGAELGITPRGLTAPPGLVAGQKLKLFFNQLVRTELGEPELARLALPLAIVATDIGSGERVVFRSGSLTTAMRASMSVPGLLAPAEVNGRKLVDGGLVDNLPVAEVRDLCQPDVVIAVNVGSPLLKAEDVGSLLSVTAQMVNILTEQNVARSIALLGPRDVYLRPELGTLTASDFQRHAEAADLGRAAAESIAAQLSVLSLPAADYENWRQRFQQAPRTPPMVDAIEITGVHRVQAAALRHQLHQKTGEPLDSMRLSQDLVELFGDGDFESVDYSLVNVDGRNVLRVRPLEKAWGPDYLRLGLALTTTLSEGASYSLRAAWHKTWLNRWGAEMLAVGEIGNNNGVAVEWFQPLGPRAPFFVDASLLFRRERFDLFTSDLRISEYIVQRGAVNLALGVNLHQLGQLRLGWHRTRWAPTVRTGLPVLDGGHATQHGLTASLEIDRFNRRYFPTDGWSLSVALTDNRGATEYQRAHVDWRQAWPLNPWVIGTRLAWTGSPRGSLPLYDSASLGGFLNLSAYASNQLAGDSMRYGHLRAERVIGTMPLGMRGDLRVGAALEAARLGGSFLPALREGTLHALTTYVGGDTPIGPIYFGLSWSPGGVRNAYLFIGAP